MTCLNNECHTPTTDKCSNAQRSNPRLHAILNSNEKADITLVQETWFDTINTRCSDDNPQSTEVLGAVANPL